MSILEDIKATIVLVTLQYYSLFEGIVPYIIKIEPTFIDSLPSFTVISPLPVPRDKDRYPVNTSADQGSQTMAIRDVSVDGVGRLVGTLIYHHADVPTGYASTRRQSSPSYGDLLAPGRSYLLKSLPTSRVTSAVEHDHVMSLQYGRQHGWSAVAAEEEKEGIINHLPSLSN
ncbi:hypothetical protein T310_6983 [Rasamsonia emersonii CBS 393.64]|uniref:Uncharacterized protein n=1 Tax=Rasamsonia emersonii (strain ATCC 16479 / CBS 393.64 / IMI 116815) TaxID=1408163 RepID=A0A0F4YLR1_RASE3|nr:hypothetical protein T310_6983 [Rasamsonia emersonii CBS 393.64]KKA19060.1 hypothetical protein T310_6983 [Rasamsonia emersonii CBS 393.64]